MLSRVMILGLFVASVFGLLFYFKEFGQSELFQNVAVEIGGALLVAAATIFIVKPFKAHEAAQKLRINHSQFHGIYVSTKPEHLNAAFIRHFADMARRLNGVHNNKSAAALYLDYDKAFLLLRDKFEKERPVYNAEGIRTHFNNTNDALLLVIKKLSWWEGRKFAKLIPRLTVTSGPNDPLRPSETEKAFSDCGAERLHSLPHSGT